MSDGYVADFGKPYRLSRINHLRRKGANGHKGILSWLAEEIDLAPRLGYKPIVELCWNCLMPPALLEGMRSTCMVKFQFWLGKPKSGKTHVGSGPQGLTWKDALLRGRVLSLASLQDVDVGVRATG